MKWKQAAIIMLDPNDPVINKDCYAWKQRYAVPDERCFTLPHASGCKIRGFTPITEGCLSFSDLSTKLIIVSHGTPGGISIGRKISNAATVSGWLERWGLQEAGLIAFRGCKLGAAGFLQDLATMIAVRRMGVGWLIGYRHTAQQWRGTWHEISGEHDARVREATGGYGKCPDSYRVRIVQGNRRVTPGVFTRRYQLETIV
ncbi:hypothetical protein AB1286_08125 [Trinickia sp. NRRL B-1857]|uniref:hypothetical protein n=1 Tax=Trinickia sp. NRRL B-1857 TaxID=3162879 RepID=UPI003D2BA83E